MDYCLKISKDSESKPIYKGSPKISLVMISMPTTNPNPATYKNIIGLPTQQSYKPDDNVDLEHYKAVVLNISYTHLSRRLQKCKEYRRFYFNF